MFAEKNQRPRIYFADLQRNWSQTQADFSYEMIDNLSRHDTETGLKQSPVRLVQRAA